MIPRWLRIWHLLWLKWEAEQNLADAKRWLAETPPKIAQLEAYIDACEVDLHLLESGSASTYSARQQS